MHGVAKVRERFPGTLESKGEKKHTLEESSGEVLKLGMVSVLKKEVAALESLTKCPHNTHLTKNISCIGFRSFKSESILMQMLELIFFSCSYHAFSYLHNCALVSPSGISFSLFFTYYFYIMSGVISLGCLFQALISMRQVG